MNKLILIILISVILAVASPAMAASQNYFWASISKLVQDFVPEEDMFFEEEEFVEEDEEFVDPKQIQDALKQIKDLKRELARLAKQAKKLVNGQEIQAEIAVLLEEISVYGSNIESGVDVRDALQDFWDAQVWEQLNPIRAKIEIPTQLKQWEKEIKKLEKTIKQKKYQSLELDLGRVREKIAEINQGISTVRDLYNAGEFGDAMDEFNNLREEFNPWDISNVIQRTQEVMAQVKKIKNAEIKEQIRQMWLEVLSNFNEGEYRIAWELMEESQKEIWSLIKKALTVGKKNGTTKENFIQMSDKVEQRMKIKAEEKKTKFQEEGERSMKEEERNQLQERQIQPSPGESNSSLVPQSAESNPSPVPEPAPQINAESVQPVQ